MEIEKKLETFQREMKHVSKVNTAKEIRVLKKVVQNLEVGISGIILLGFIKLALFISNVIVDY